MSKEFFQWLELLNERSINAVAFYIIVGQTHIDTPLYSRKACVLARSDRSRIDSEIEEEVVDETKRCLSTHATILSEFSFFFRRL